MVPELMRASLDSVIVAACARPHNEELRVQLIDELQRFGFHELADALNANGYAIVRLTWNLADQNEVEPNFDALYRAFITLPPDNNKTITITAGCCDEPPPYPEKADDFKISPTEEKEKQEDCDFQKLLELAQLDRAKRKWIDTPMRLAPTPTYMDFVFWSGAPIKAQHSMYDSH